MLTSGQILASRPSTRRQFLRTALNIAGGLVGASFLPSCCGTPASREETRRLNQNCGCIVQQQDSLTAYQQAVASDNFLGRYPTDARGWPIFEPGKVGLGLMPGDNNPNDAATFTDNCGENHVSPEGYQAFKIDQHTYLTEKPVAAAKTYTAFSWGGVPLGDLIREKMLTMYHQKGALPFLHVDPLDWQNPNANAYPALNISQGDYDDLIIVPQARAVAALDYPIVIAFAPESNVSAYGRANDPEDIKQSYRHYREIFLREGATNVIWAHTVGNYVAAPSICPLNYLDAESNCPIESIDAHYPGDFIDLILVDGYNWGNTLQSWGNSSWQTFDQVFLETVTYLRQKHPDKYFGLGEFGSSSFGGDKPAWIKDAYEKMTKPPYNFVIAIYFNIQKETDWWLF